MRANMLGVGGLVLLLSSFAHVVDSHALPHNATIKGRALNSFDFTSGNGNCNNYMMTKLGRWVPDISVLADSAIRALDEIDRAPFSGDIKYTLGNFLGIYEGDTAGIATARKWFSDVKSFSQGSFGAFGFSKAFMFCGDNYQVTKSPYDVAQEENGDPVTINGRQKTIYQISEYAAQINAGYTPFWIKALGGYLFTGLNQFRPGTPGDRCSVAFAFTSNPIKQKSSITFCIYPTAQGTAPVDYFAADTILQARGIAGMGDLLDGEASGSTILMHEMFHATRGGAATIDYATNSQACFNKVVNGAINEAQASPQCAVVFALAMDLMYAGGVDQDGDPQRVYWWMGISMSRKDAMKKLKSASGP